MKDDIRILGVITARGGSKGIPGKNTKDLLGKPLVAWTIETAKKSKLITDLIVSTDDEEIARVAREYGAEVPFMRPKELAEDSTPHLPVMQHAITEMEKRTGALFKLAVILQPTAPFRKAADIDATIEKIRDREDADSAVSLVEVETKAHPIKIKHMDANGRVHAYIMEEEQGTRRQDLPTAYRRSGDVYVITRKCLMEKEKLYGDVILGHVVDGTYYVDIDEPIDWHIAEIVGKDLV